MADGSRCVQGRALLFLLFMERRSLFFEYVSESSRKYAIQIERLLWGSKKRFKKKGEKPFLDWGYTKSCQTDVSIAV